MKNIQIILNAVLSKNIFEYILINKNFEVVYTSSGIERYVTFMPEVGQDILEYCPELVGAEDEVEKIFTNPSYTYMLESVHKGEFYINISVEHYDENTSLILFHNITEVALSRQKVLQYSNESILVNNTLQKIIDKQNALVFVSTGKNISYCNAQFMDYFSINKMEEIARKNIKIYDYLDDSIDNYDELFERVNDKEEYITINNDVFILRATYIETTQKLFTLSKVTQLSKEVHKDALTGVYKKKYFNSELQNVIDNHKDAVVVVIDIDDFKMVNDNYGHQVGDDVLKEFASLIKNNIRADDIFARWGGEEFLLLLKSSNSENALKKIEALRIIVDEYSFNHIGELTASFGVAKLETTDDLHRLLQRADKALYKAKNLGKNRVEFKKE